MMLWLPCQQWLPDQLFLIRLRALLWHSLLCKLVYLGSSCIRLFVARMCVCVVTFMYFRKMVQYSSLALGWSSDAIQEIESVVHNLKNLSKNKGLKLLEVEHWRWEYQLENKNRTKDLKSPTVSYGFSTNKAFSFQCLGSRVSTAQRFECRCCYILLDNLLPVEPHQLNKFLGKWIWRFGLGWIGKN